MGLFGDDTPFRQQANWGDTGGSSPAGWYTYGNAPQTPTGSTPLQFYNPGTGQVTNTDELNSLVGPGSDSVGNATGWRKPGTYSNQNLDLILRNKDSLAAGNNLPFQNAAFQRDFLNNPNTISSDPSAYLYNGDPNFAKNQQQGLAMQAAAAQGRAAPQIDAGATNMFATGAGNSLAQANGTNFLGVGNAQNLAGTASGPDIAGQRAAAGRLMDLSNEPDGPSPAELQLRAGGDAAMRQQMSMASAARGGNTAGALQNAAAQQGNIMGQLNQQQAQLRATEELQNAQYRANTASAAGSLYGQAAGTAQNAYGGAGQALQGIAGSQVAQANTQGQLASMYGGLAAQNASNAIAQGQQNDTYSLGLQNLGQTYLTNQMHGTSAYDQNRTGNAANVLTNQYANRDRSGEGTLTGSAGGDKALGMGLQAGGIVAGALSDIRAKKDVVPASGEISDAYRSLYGMVGDPWGSAPGYAYRYKDPNAPGAAPGVHYGPMAQDLEKTPAGASVVVDKPNGQKGVDTGRLSLLNASQLSAVQKNLDALNAQAATIRGTPVAYPGAPPTAAFPPVGLDARAGIDMANAQAAQIQRTPVAYPAASLYGAP